MSSSEKKSRKKKVAKSFVSKKTEVAKIAKVDGVNFRLTFLSNQKFRGQFFKKGDSIEVPAWVAQAYKARSCLKFEQL